MRIFWRWTSLFRNTQSVEIIFSLTVPDICDFSSSKQTRCMYGVLINPLIVKGIKLNQRVETRRSETKTKTAVFQYRDRNTDQYTQSSCMIRACLETVRYINLTIDWLTEQGMMGSTKLKWRHGWLAETSFNCTNPIQTLVFRLFVLVNY